MKKTYLICLTIALFSSSLSGQGISINEDGAAPDAAATPDVLDSENGYLNPRMNKAKEIAKPANPLIKKPRLNEQPIDFQETIVKTRKSDSERGMTLHNTISSSAEEASGAVGVPVFQSKVLIFLIGLLTLVGARKLLKTNTS